MLPFHKFPKSPNHEQFLKAHWKLIYVSIWVSCDHGTATLMEWLMVRKGNYPFIADLFRWVLDCNWPRSRSRRYCSQNKHAQDSWSIIMLHLVHGPLLAYWPKIDGWYIQRYTADMYKLFVFLQHIIISIYIHHKFYHLFYHVFTICSICLPYLVPFFFHSQTPETAPAPGQRPRDPSTAVELGGGHAWGDGNWDRGEWLRPGDS